MARRGYPPEFRRRVVALVEPVDPFECGELDLVNVAPRPVRVDDLGLLEAVDRFGQGVVVGVAVRLSGACSCGQLQHALRTRRVEHRSAARGCTMGSLGHPSSQTALAHARNGRQFPPLNSNPHPTRRYSPWRLTGVIG